ncbi:MAG: HAMP domain-containing sensor histidine kinase [Alphaproteobacteria bacterium]
MSQPGSCKTPFRYGLSFKLLLLTIVFVMLAEVLIFVPSVASFRANWLMERLAAAQIASLAVRAAPNNTVPNRLRKQLLQKAMVHGVAVRREGVRILVLKANVPGMVAAHYNMENASMLKLIGDVWDTFFAPTDRLIRVVGKPDLSDDAVEIVMTERPLKLALCRYSVRILGLSFLISLISATLVYLALNYMFVRPVRRLTRNIVGFREDPEDTRRILTPTSRRDEIGVAQTELSAMQNELVGMLRQKSRLAALGLAVSKISHDLRNMLSTAQLMSDGLTASHDPIVQRWTPKLISSLDRAITLCMETLRYGRAEEAAPERQLFPLRPLLDEVGESLGLPGHRRIRWSIDTGDELDLELNADRNQMYRVLTNLVRNAVQILETPPDILRPEIRVTARRQNSGIVISIADNGPGVPQKAQAHLFQAFQGSARVGGTGLGLAISAELIQAHGGRIWLDPDAISATFHIFLPQQGNEKAETSSPLLNNVAVPLAFGRSKH